MYTNDVVSYNLYFVRVLWKLWDHPIVASVQYQCFTETIPFWCFDIPGSGRKPLGMGDGSGTTADTDSLWNWGMVHQRSIGSHSIPHPTLSHYKHTINPCWLVVLTILKKKSSQWKGLSRIPYIMENKTCSKPPTSISWGPHSSWNSQKSSYNWYLSPYHMVMCQHSGKKTNHQPA
jgi:hypothetical protein